MEATLETKAETILEFITDTWVPHAVRHNHSRGAEQDQVGCTGPMAALVNMMHNSR
jgi:hypothetical protein